MHARLAMKTQLRVAPQQVMASTLLQTTVADLDHYIEQALIENPALERVEPRSVDARATPLTASWDDSLTHYTAVAPCSADDSDPTEQLIAAISPLDHLRTQLSLLADSSDLALTLNLVDSLDHHGYLRIALPELAEE